MARLIPIAIGTAPQVELQRPVLLFGRHPECDVRLDLPQISRRHCCVAIAYDRIVIRDLGSRNGVRVNGRIVEESCLRSGDEIAIGHILYRLDGAEAVPNRTTAPVKVVQPGGDDPLITIDEG